MSCLTKIIKFLKPNRKTDIELFIESKNPKSPADVEHWIRHYNYRRD